MSNRIVAFSALKSDIQRNPHLLEGMQLEAAARLNFACEVTTVEQGSVITVTAVAA